MAKEKKAAAAVAAQTQTTQVTNSQAASDLDSTYEQMKKGNLITKEINEKAAEEIAKSREAARVEEAKSAMKEAEFINYYAVLLLRKSRAEAKVYKKYLEETKKCLDGLVGTTNEKGEWVPGTLSYNEWVKARNEAEKEKVKGFDEAAAKFNEEYDELKNQFPNYWSYRCNIREARMY